MRQDLISPKVVYF